MRIHKVVYMEECSSSDWDGGNSYSYMGESNWILGDSFCGGVMKGTVTDIYRRGDGEVLIEVGGRTAMSIPSHAVQRLYYGED